MQRRRVEPGPGQESVWDYPRPPVVDHADAHVVVRFAGQVVADTVRPIRILETSQPPAFYLPTVDVDTSLLVASPKTTWCEFKGGAAYHDVVVGDRVAPAAAWSYPDPVPRYADLAGHVAFYAQAMDSCTVDGETVEGNEGDFYGGWITSKVVGPFKGGPGTRGW